MTMTVFNPEGHDPKCSCGKSMTRIGYDTYACFECRCSANVSGWDYDDERFILIVQEEDE